MGSEQNTLETIIQEQYNELQLYICMYKFRNFLLQSLLLVSAIIFTEVMNRPGNRNRRQNQGRDTYLYIERHLVPNTETRGRQVIPRLKATQLE